MLAILLIRDSGWWRLGERCIQTLFILVTSQFPNLRCNAHNLFINVWEIRCQAQYHSHPDQKRNPLFPDLVFPSAELPRTLKPRVLLGV